MSIMDLKATSAVYLLGVVVWCGVALIALLGAVLPQWMVIAACVCAALGQLAAFVESEEK